jgi:hypothetical protein
MSDEWGESRGKGNQQRKGFRGWREKATRDRVCKVVNGAHINKCERDACLLAYLIRMTNGKIHHEIGTLALQKGTNGSFVITSDKNICIMNTHHP